MEISLLDVQEVFNDLLNHEISRDDAEEWARKRMNALDNQVLIFESRIKEYLLYKQQHTLINIELKIFSNKYIQDENIIKKTSILESTKSIGRIIILK
ncbi:hypothetical protein ACT4X9_05875 [Acinetobacter baumannii]